jgi:predicted GTPase
MSTLTESGVREHTEEFMREFGNIPIISCSALYGQTEATQSVSGVDAVLREVIRTHDAWSFRVDTWVLNKWLKDILVTSPVPMRVENKTLKVKYIPMIM